MCCLINIECRSFSETDTLRQNTQRKTQGQGLIHKTALRQAQIQTHNTDAEGLEDTENNEFVKNSKQDLLLDK